MPKKEAVLASPVRILKIGTCPSISGRSELTYQVGCNAEGDIHVRVVRNSSTGQFNPDSILLALIEKLLAEHSADNPMTSAVMRPAYRGKSSNSPAFLFAALKAEGLVKAGEGKDDGYLLGDIEAFKQAMSALAAGGTNLDVATDVPIAPAKGKRRSKETA